MKKIFLMAFIAFCSVSFGAVELPIIKPSPGKIQHTIIPCKDIAKADCIKRNGCNQMTEASDEQNSCMESCEEMAESACNR